MKLQSSLMHCTIFTALFLVNLAHAQVCTFSFSLGADTSFCPGAAINFNLVAPSGLSPYLWDNGSVAATRHISSTGIYYCTASQLGPEVVLNGNFDQGYSGFTSDYIVGTGGTWGPISNPATYVVESSTTLAHTNFVPFPDHSGSGNMMIVNGASTPNISVWCQSIFVSPNTDYNFSAWVSSCESGQPASQLAQLQFSINGTVIGNQFSPTAVANSWSQFAAGWNSGTNANAVICIVNQNTAAAGNDFAMDDISFKPICKFTDTVYVKAKPLPVLVSAGSDSAICVGDSTTLNANQGTGTSFAWSSIPIGFNAQVVNPAVSPAVTTFYIFASTLSGCTKKDTVKVVVHTLPVVGFDFTTLDSSCTTFSVGFENYSINATGYQWDFGDGTTSVDTLPIHNYASQGTYTVTLNASNSFCSISKDTTVKVAFGGGTFILPNVITPNGDASNDSFFVPKECISNASVSIYNRWGTLVKKWEGLDGSWDGKIKGNTAAEGVYYYVMEASYPNGETTRQQGTISLYR